MNQHRLFRIVRSLAVLALLLSSLPIHSTAFSQAPIETPASPTLLEGGIRLPPPPDQPEVEAPVAPPVAAPSVDQSSEPPAAPAPFSTQAPNACGADPKKLSFGQDLELLLGPLGNTTSTRIDQPPAWTGTAAVNVTGVLTQSVTGCAANPLPEQVYFYEDANYSGGCYILGPGQFKDGSSMGVHNDHLSSVKIGSNVKVTIYEDTNFSGSSETFAVNVPAMSGTSIHNDHASSAKVWLLPTAYGNIAAAPAGIDRAMTLYKTAPITGELAMQAWDAVTGWSINWTRMGFPTGSTSTDGNPALISRGTDWLIFARYGGKIAYRVQNVGIWGAWAEVLGISAAASDPAVVSMDPNHVNLFYKNASGTVYFTQWEAGRGWREAPKSLGKPSATVSIASELSAIARDENHIAVFGVGSDNKLYVKEWSTDRLSDWSDTTWVGLASNVNTTVKPTVASRYTGQVGVAVLTTSSATGGYTSIYREWTATQAKNYPSTTPVGWKTAVTLAGGLMSIGLAATAVDELFVQGVNSSGTAYSKQWTEAGGWGAWVSQGTGWEAGQVIATAVSRPHDLMLIGRATGNRVQAKRYTNQDQALTQTTLANSQTGGLRRQVVATVQGQTYWFSSYLDGTNRWVLEARSTSNWATAYTRVITAAHGTNTSATDNVALAVGDLDQDGDDEVIVATKSSNNSQYQVSINKLVLAGSTIGITPLAWTSQAISTSVSDVQVAVGDLDGDGAEHEFVVAVRLSNTNQVFFRTYQFAANAITTLTDDRYVTIGYTGWDLEVAIGRLGAQSAAPAEEQIIFMSSGCFVSGLRSCGSQLAIWRVFYQAPADDEADWQAVPVYESPVNKTLLTQAEGAYSSALATGDVDSDGWDEIVRTYGSHFSTLNVTQDMTGTVSATTGASALVGPSDANRSVTVGDLDGDGRPEVVYNGGAFGGTRVFKQMLPDSDRLNVVGAIALAGVPLLADLDGDSAVATWQACNVFADYRVLSVANAEPMWYQNGAPVTGQVSAGGMGNHSGATTSAEDAWSVTLGGSVSVGFEHEFSVPLAAVKLGEVRASVTQEFMGRFGRKTERSTTVTEGEGGLYGGNSLGFGSVCYTATSYTCSKYIVARPGSTYTTTAMTCRPDSTVGVGTHTCNPLEDWYGSLRSAAGTSWVPVGHHTTNPKALSYDVSKYPVSVAPPLSDTYQLWWVKKDPINIVSTSKPENPAGSWNVQSDEGTSYFSTGSFDANTTVSAGATMMDVTVDASFTAGYGKEWSSGVGWTQGMEFSGDIYHFPDACPVTVCRNYSIKPYVYKAKAKTEAGLTYPYFEQDYFVTARTDAARVQTASPAVVGLIPQAPVITSTTHPNPANWYTANTVTFEWGQPAGDQAVITGYRWNLTRASVMTPTAVAAMTTTHTYEGLADGVYYLHIQAVGDGGDRGPVTHQAVRVDLTTPAIEFVPNPLTPDGFTGWYKTPVTLTVVATDTIGSGVTSVEISTDGLSWQPYTASIPITRNTPGLTVWTRATDLVGLTSTPISITIKLDKTRPTITDGEGYGLTYANVMTDEVGNAQLMLGGALSDTLSGRMQFEVKAGETGQWHPASVVGDLPMPPDNEFPTALTSLNWIYTPTFEIRGVYELLGRGVDQAGNYGYYSYFDPSYPIGLFWWEPDDVPVLDESRLSASTQQAYPGNEVAFTVAARNSGYQEAQLLITDTVPAGLTVLPYSISDDGQYDAGTGVITWRLHALWPGQTRYLFFSTLAESVTTSVTLTNQVDLMAYWPWLDYPGIPAEPARHYYSTTATVSVLPGAVGRAAAVQAGKPAPRILGASVLEGEITSERQTMLLVNATSDARYLYVKEWTWDGLLDQWALDRESGWVPFEDAPDLKVVDYLFGRSGQYQWTLSAGDGVKYLGVWVADAGGQISNLNDGNLIFTNLISSGGQQLAANQGVQYRVTMSADQLALLSLASLSGDADLYVWKPRAGFKPNYYSNGAPSDQGLSIDTIGVQTPEEGMYVIEVQAVTDAYYRLITDGDLANTTLQAATGIDPALARLTDRDLNGLQAQVAALSNARQTLPSSTHLTLAEKERPAHPSTLSTPYQQPYAETVPVIQGATMTYLYLPLIVK